VLAKGLAVPQPTMVHYYDRCLSHMIDKLAKGYDFMAEM